MLKLTKRKLQAGLLCDDDENRRLFKLPLLLLKNYTSLGGQAVIEGVMMRSPNAFVVAVRKPNGEIRLRRDQWYGLGNRISLFRKPFFRGILMLIEAMANGIVALNYSANVAMGEEIDKKKSESVDIMTFLTILTAFAFGMTIFVFLPHAATEGLNQGFSLGLSLKGMWFHTIDGLIKAFVFIFYVYFIGKIPDIRRVFQYHGAEHKSIATFEGGESLVVKNSLKYSKLHPRCGTSFVFFLLLVSIIFFSGVFSTFSFGEDLPFLMKHIIAIIAKIGLMIPIAGISYEIIKYAGRYPSKLFCKFLSFPGMMLQNLTTREPDEKQLEVALASIRAVLALEEKYKLGEANKKLVNLEEIDIKSLDDLDQPNSSLKDFLE